MMRSAAQVSGELRGAYGLAVPPDVFAPRLNAIAASSPSWTFDITPGDRPFGSGDQVTAPASGREPLGPAQDEVPVDLETSFRTQVVFDGRTAEAKLLVGTLYADADSRTATFAPDAPFDGERLIHPTLATLAVLAAHWSGDVGLHAGAVVVDGNAWGILAARGHGKSTTLAALATAGFPVIADDLLVITPDLQVHAGPRCVDLRRSSAEQYPAAVPVDAYAGRRTRYRLPLDPVSATTPLAGFIALAWDDATGLAPIRTADRLSLVAGAATIRGARANPRLMLDLATLPSFVLHRPKRLDALGATVKLIASVNQRRRGALAM